jgi:hypothetical protein
MQEPLNDFHEKFSDEKLEGKGIMRGMTNEMDGKGIWE